MKCFKNIFILVAVLASSSQLALAGSYSTALANDPLINPDAPDPGIPGFVGPHGDGKARLDNGDGTFQNPDNYVNPLFVGWATGYLNYLPSDSSWSGDWANPAKALGPVTGNNTDIVSLGDLDTSEIASSTLPGQITLTFDKAISNGSGPDFALFENGFISSGGAGVAGQILAEFAYVEVSTDGTNFARFPSISLTLSQVGPYGTIDPTDVYNLAGKHVNASGDSWGTPFNLDDLLDNADVLSELVDLAEINYVRLVDIPGDGSFADSVNNPIYDAWVTWGAGGFDLNAVGILNTPPELTTGDFDEDGDVDGVDFGRWQTGYPIASGAILGDGDADDDGDVDGVDFGLWQSNYPTAAVAAVAGPTAIPEPSTLGLLLIGGLAMLRRGS